MLSLRLTISSERTAMHVIFEQGKQMIDISAL